MVESIGTIYTNKLIGDVIIGGDFQGLGVIRSLAEKGIPTFLIEYEKGIARYSKYTKRVKYNNSIFSQEVFLDYMIEIAKKESLEGWVLYPTNDTCVRLLAKNYEKLENYYRNPVSPWDITRKIFHKKETYEIAKKIDIPIPTIYRGTTLNDILDNHIEFPVILKPDNNPVYFAKTKKKAVRVDSVEELKKKYEEMSTIIDPSEIIIQEMIEGGTENLYSYTTFFERERSVAGISAKQFR